MAADGGGFGRRGPPPIPSGRPGVGGVRISFPQSRVFDSARMLVARTNMLVSGLNRTWNVGLTVPDRPRFPPKTLTRRKGPAPRQPRLAEVIQHFTATRNMFEVTPLLRQRLGTDVVTQLLPALLQGVREPTPEQIMGMIAVKYHQAIVWRWESGGGDLALKTLNPKYLGYKLRLGYPGRIGTFTGQSLQAIRNATLSVHRL